MTKKDAIKIFEDKKIRTVWDEQTERKRDSLSRFENEKQEDEKSK